MKTEDKMEIEKLQGQLMEARAILYDLHQEHINSYREAIEIGYSDGFYLPPQFKERIRHALIGK